MSSSAGTSRKPKILLVDDDPALLRALRRVLAGVYDLTPAASGDEALALLAAGAHFDALVSDYLLAGMNGVALMDAVAVDHPDLAAGAILLTGGELPQPWEGRADVQVLFKPIDGNVLRQAIARALQRSQKI